MKLMPVLVSVSAIVALSGCSADVSAPPAATAPPAMRTTPKPAAPKTSTAKPVKPSEKPTDVTSDGIDYTQVLAPCDAAAQRNLFPGMKYKPHALVGQQKAQVVGDGKQFLAVYNVDVNGRRTAISCLTTGKKGAVEVLTVTEVPAT